MTGRFRRCVVALAVVYSSFGFVRTALAERHRVAAVDSDEELARALDIALSPWGATVTLVNVHGTGATDWLSVERARAIARDTHADVVMWVSRSDRQYAAWIYDVASDQASLRELTSAPPFDATTAAAVALSVKALLRFTVVAPPPERFGATAEDATWTFGLSASIATHFGLEPQPEPRGGVAVSFWPAALGHQWGAIAGISSGTGVVAKSDVFNGNLQDFAARVAVGLRIPFRPWLALEPSIGASAHFFSLQYTAIFADKTSMSGTVQHFSPGFDPQVALNIALLRGFVRLVPWAGMTFLQQPHLFRVQSVNESALEQLQVALVTAEGGVRAELALP